jgi:uncharacterized membrane protein
MLLVSRHWAENRRRYLLALPAMGGLLTAWYSFLLIMDGYRPLNDILQSMAYYFGLYIVGCLYASTLFSELGSKAECINYLSVPASQLEKLLCSLFFGVLLFFIAFNLIYYAVDIPMVHLANHVSAERYGNGMQPGGSIMAGPAPVWNAFAGTDPVFHIGKYHVILLAFFAIQSAFILGSVYFTRYAFLKTIVAILFCSLGVSFFLTKIIEGHLPQGWWLNNIFEWEHYSDTTGIRVVSLPLWIEHCLIFLTQYSIPFIFWWITYYRLKEKEV